MKSRIEQKLELEKSDYLVILKWLKNNNGNILYPNRIINSRYFDTVNYRMYYETLEGIVPRKKIRLRSYSSKRSFFFEKECNLEFKLTNEFSRYKEIKYGMNFDELNNNGIFDSSYGYCFPKVDISYNREYFFIMGNRMTIDKEIKYRQVNTFNHLSPDTISEENIVLEIKADSKKSSTDLLNEFPFPRSRFSKYERAINSFIN